MHVRFHPSCNNSVKPPGAPIMGSVAFPRGFPTRLSHRAVTRATVVGVNPRRESRGCAEKQVPLDGLRHQGDSWNDARTLEFLLPFLWRVCPPEMRWDAQNSFPSKQEKDPSSRAMRRKRGSSGCGRDSRASSRVETRMSGNFLSCSKGVKDLLEVPGFRCD